MSGRCTWQVPALEGALEELERAGVLIMVTSRRLVNPRLAGPLKHNLQSVGHAAAAQLLKARAGSTEITDPEADELVALCGCNALYITIIASFLSDLVTPQVGYVVLVVSA
jgi:hypothetical protein